MTAWDRYWFDPVAAVRPYVLERAILFLLALDAWVQFVPHGGRYGAGGSRSWCAGVKKLRRARVIAISAAIETAPSST